MTSRLRRRAAILDEESGVYPVLTVSSAAEGILFLCNKYDALLEENGTAIVPDGYERSPANIFPYPLPFQVPTIHLEVKEVKEVKAGFVAGTESTILKSSTSPVGTTAAESEEKSVPRLFCFYREKPKQWMSNSNDKMFLQPFYVYVVYHSTR